MCSNTRFPNKVKWLSKLRAGAHTVNNAPRSGAPAGHLKSKHSTVQSARGKGGASVPRGGWIH